MAEIVRNMTRYTVLIILLVMATVNCVWGTSEKSATNEKTIESDSTKMEKSSNNEETGNKFFTNWIQSFFGMTTTEVPPDPVDEDIVPAIDLNDNKIVQIK